MFPEGFGTVLLFCHSLPVKSCSAERFHPGLPACQAEMPDTQKGSNTGTLFHRDSPTPPWLHQCFQYPTIPQVSWAVSRKCLSR